MKIYISYIFTMAFAAIFVMFNPAVAGERVRIFEMGESGAIIEFPMTPDEIAAEDAAYGQLIVASKKSVVRENGNLKFFEMGEGGHMVAFPMTAAEITATNAENARLAAVKSAKTRASPEPGVRFELSESGQIIEFPVPDSEMDHLASAPKPWTLGPD